MGKSPNPYIDKLAKNPVIAKHFAEGRDTPPDLWSRAEMAAYQVEALQYLLAHAHANSPFYRAKFDAAGVKPEDLRQLSDIARFPFVKKDELRRAPWTALATSRDRVCQIHMSTGTTSESIGDHIYSLLTWDDIFLNEVAARFAFMMPYKPGDVVVVALPYEMSSAGFSMHRAYQQASGCVVVNAGKGGFYSEPKKTALMLKDLRANVLATTPSYALYLWEAAAELGIDVKRDIGLKFLWLGGEGSSNALRKRVERCGAAPRFATTAHSSAGRSASSARSRTGCTCRRTTRWSRSWTRSPARCCPTARSARSASPCCTASAVRSSATGCRTSA